MPTPTYIQTCIDRCESELRGGYITGRGPMTGMDREMVQHQLRLHLEALQAISKPEQPTDETELNTKQQSLF